MNSDSGESRLRQHLRITGLTRAKLYELAGKGHIRTVSLREPGEVKG